MKNEFRAIRNRALRRWLTIAVGVAFIFCAGGLVELGRTSRAAPPSPAAPEEVPQQAPKVRIDAKGPDDLDPFQPAIGAQGPVEPFQQAAVAIPVEANDDEGNADSASNKDSGTAQLNADPEHMELIHRAEQCVHDGRYDLATVLWQRVLDEAGNSLMSRDQWQTVTPDGQKYRRYKSVTVELLSTIAKLPPEGLRVYRASVDADARSILATALPDHREAALSEVVRRYFLSSVGDDAAMELAGRAMDRHDFIGALRLLNRIDSLYPDPSVSKGDVLLRIAVANARLGDLAASQAALDRLDKLTGARPSPQRIAAIRADIFRAAPLSSSVTEARNWSMRLGSPAGDGHMSSLPASVTAEDLSDNWFDDELMDLSSKRAPVGTVRAMLIRQQRLMAHHGALNIPGPSPVAATPAVSQEDSEREEMVQRWQQLGATPSGQMLIRDGRVYYKTENRVTCRDITTGKLDWQGWKNDYLPASRPMTQIYNAMAVQMEQQGQGGNFPASFEEMQFLSDRVHPAMSVSGNLLLAIEGEPDGLAAPAEPPRTNNFFAARMNSVLRQRENVLAAYDVVTGKRIWPAPMAEAKSESEATHKIGYLAAPVPYAQELLVPLVDNGVIGIAALDRNTGKVIWKTMLCDEAENAGMLSAPVGVAVDGGDVYVATGAGYVAALDALAGSIHWIVQYPRRSSNNDSDDFDGAIMVPRQRSWSEDTVIARGPNLIVLPSDSDEIMALDRRSGELRWKTARASVREASGPNYCLGVLGDYLYVAGRNVVQCYKMTSTDMANSPQWEFDLTNSLGRGLLTDNAIYVPDRDSVIRLDPRPTGVSNEDRVLARAKVISTSGEPLGNLYSDGSRLLVQGLSRVYVLEGLSQRMARLAGQIAKGDFEASFERMRLNQRIGRTDEALADLRQAYVGAQRQLGQSSAMRRLYAGIEELNLARTRGDSALQLMLTAESDFDRSPEAPAEPADLIQKRSSLVSIAIASIHDADPHVKLSLLLSTANLCSDDYLLERLQKLVRSAAHMTDLTMLQEAARNANADTRLMAVAALGAISDSQASTRLASLMRDGNERVRGCAARELAARGDRASLPVLAGLLESSDMHVRARAFSVLRALTGQEFGYRVYVDEAARSKPVERWKQWVATSAADAKLNLPLHEMPPTLGRILLGSMAGGLVVELDNAGNETWRLHVATPFGVEGLPNGHRLIAEYSARTVVEFDETGKPVWSLDNLPGNPSCVQRLSNGNTLVVMSNSGQVLEFSPDKRQVAGQNYGMGVGFALRVDNGNTLICQPREGRVAEFNSEGKIVATFAASNPVAARRLDNGNTLIVEQGLGRVIEMDATGKIVWQHAQVAGAWDAERLPNGNTVISHARGVQEFDPAGKPVHEWKFQNVYRLSAY